MSDCLPVSVPKEVRLQYFEALEAYAVHGDIQPFAAFVAELEEKELDRMIEIIEQVKENQDEEDWDNEI